MPLDSKILVPGFLGASLVAVTGFVIYYITKKDEDELKHGKGRSIQSSHISTIEVKVPTKHLAALIGRHGSNIKEIRQKTDTTILFRKTEDKEYEICVVRGSSEKAQLAETLIHEFINNQPDIIEDTMSIPYWSCGRIIGTQGSNIQDISHRSGARIKVEGQGVGEIRNVNLKGTKQQILAAKELIESEVAHAKCQREISASKRAPRFASSDEAVTDHVDSSTLNNSNPEVKKNEPVNGSVPQQGTRQSSPSKSVCGAAMDVMVSAVASPSRFWIQLNGPQVAKLDALVQNITDYYNNERNRNLHKLKSVRVGSIVACVFRADGRWYRGRISRLLSPEELGQSAITNDQIADIFFVDYGDSEYVAVSELYELRADFLKLKFQALECFLANIKPAKVSTGPMGDDEDVWDTKAIDRFEELTQAARWKNLISKTVTYRERTVGKDSVQVPGIKLYDVSNDGELDIGDVLIAEGWAEYEP